MNSSSPLRGVLAPNLTPFEDDGRIAMDLYVAHAKRLLEQGCVGLVPFGTTGEALSVGIDERISALNTLVESGIDPDRLLPGAGLTNLADTLRLVEAAADVNCRGVLVLPPFFFKNVPDEGLYRYFAELVAATRGSGCGIYIYHIPQVAGVGVPPSVVRRLRARVSRADSRHQGQLRKLGEPGGVVYDPGPARVSRPGDLSLRGARAGRAGLHYRNGESECDWRLER